MNSGNSQKIPIILTIFLLGIVCGIAYLTYQNHQLEQKNFILTAELTETRADFASTSQKLLSDIDAFRSALLETQSGRISAEQNVRTQNEVLDTMSKTLNTYEKIVTTDRELLTKYSRVYFLSENYHPRALTLIPTQYTYETGTKKTIAHGVLPFLTKMLDDAQGADVDLRVISAFRSFDTQSTLKSTYKITFGSGANRFSADQGYSEHQLGTTVDFTTTKLGAKNETFEKTASYPWLIENAYKYGFILSYPKNNSYYIFEPWHWRFVGKKLAQMLHDENKNFADIPQREIDEYLMSLFD